MSDLTSPPRRVRVVLCRGAYCNLGRRADKLYDRLKVIVDEINGSQHPKPVKLEIASCLSMCAVGPNLVIYPADEVFSHLDESKLEEVRVCIEAEVSRIQA